MNSLNIHDVNYMQSYKLGDVMFDEDDIFTPPSFGEINYYDDSMPPIYDNYNDESGFGEGMTLFSDESTILDEASIDYDNKVAIYDDYSDDMYAIKNNDNHETCHHDFNFLSHDSYFVEFAPTTIDENKIAYVESNKFSMLVDHEKNALCDSYIVEFIHDATKIIMREEHMLLHIAIMLIIYTKHSIEFFFYQLSTIFLSIIFTKYIIKMNNMMQPQFHFL